jgi:hypothetical protein
LEGCTQAVNAISSINRVIPRLSSKDQEQTLAGSHQKSHRNLSQRTHPIYLIGPQTHVFVRFKLFRYCKNFGAKNAELVQLMHQFLQRSRVGIFRIKRTRSTLLHSNSCFGAFCIVSLLHELRCKTNRTCAINAQVHAMKSCRNFSQRTHLIHPI